MSSSPETHLHTATSAFSTFVHTQATPVAIQSDASSSSSSSADFAPARTLASLGGSPVGLAARSDRVRPPAAAALAAAGKPRRRRPRTAIHLPVEDTSTLDKDELRKIKNRIAAARARERSQQRVNELEAVVRELWNRVQYVEGVVLDMQPSLSLRELYSGYQPQVQLSPSTLASSTGAFHAPNATFDLRELSWMFAPTEPHST